MLKLGLMNIEVYDRLYDPNTNKFLDLKSNISGSKFDTQYKETAFKPLALGQFLGLARNEDDVTKILISKEDQLKDKLSRQVVFGADNKPITNIPGDEDVITKMMDIMSDEEQDLE